jgi:ATP-binding cassette subfamily F protein uup
MAALSDLGLSARPRPESPRTARLAAAQAELDAAETEWLELELLREELGG